MSCTPFARLFCRLRSPRSAGPSLEDSALLASSDRGERLARSEFESPCEATNPSFAYSIALDSRLENSSLPNLFWKAWTPFTRPGTTTEKGPKAGTPRCPRASGNLGVRREGAQPLELMQ